jgi:hypothetical protein
MAVFANKSRKTNFILLLFLLFVTSCAPIVEDDGPMEATKTPTTAVLSDCWRSIHMFVWSDRNGDGIQSGDEAPIAGVGYKIIGRFAELMTDPTKITDEDGAINISLWSPGNCAKGDFEVRVAVPAKYELTTINPIKFTLLSSESSYNARFGLREKEK